MNPAGPNGTNGTNFDGGIDGGDAAFSPPTPALEPTPAIDTGPNASGDEGAMGFVRGGASKLRSQAADRARSAAEDGKLRATETIDGFARSVHDIAANLEEQVGPQLAQYAHRAADALDEFSANLREKDVEELVDDAREFVRRSPAIAIGAAVALGFALSRFLKATAAEGARTSRNDFAIEDEDDVVPTLTTERSTTSQPRYDA